MAKIIIALVLVVGSFSHANFRDRFQNGGDQQDSQGHVGMIASEEPFMISFTSCLDNVCAGVLYHDYRTGTDYYGRVEVSVTITDQSLMEGIRRQISKHGSTGQKTCFGTLNPQSGVAVVNRMGR